MASLQQSKILCMLARIDHAAVYAGRSSPENTMRKQFLAAYLVCIASVASGCLPAWADPITNAASLSVNPVVFVGSQSTYSGVVSSSESDSLSPLSVSASATVGSQYDNAQASLTLSSPTSGLFSYNTSSFVNANNSGALGGLNSSYLFSVNTPSVLTLSLAGTSSASITDKFGTTSLAGEGFQVQINNGSTMTLPVSGTSTYNLQPGVNQINFKGEGGYYGNGFSPGNPTSVTSSLSEQLSFSVAPAGFSQACLNLITGTVHPLATGPLSATGQPTVITAKFNPNSILTVAETACGLSQFDWVQTVNSIPSPIPVSFAPKGSSTPLPTPFNDPPNGGYNYTLWCSYSPNGNTRTYFNPSSANPNPFYFDPKASPQDCFSLDAHEQSTSPAFPPNQLDFSDSPADPLLPNGTAISFTTCLAGVDNAGNEVPLPQAAKDCFNWTDSYTGLMQSCQPATAQSEICVIGSNGGGALNIQLASLVPSGYPGLGTGGITILTDVPEPSTLLLLTSFSTPAILLYRKKLSRLEGKSSRRRTSWDADIGNRANEIVV